ncbi:MAG: hypothetical protein J5685_08980 [Clostridiales bacterium]|nr:hypothetical protein [Clostridiales bacterium]
MDILRKATSGAAAVLIFMSAAMFPGCSLFHKDDDPSLPSEVSADTPWYDIRRSDIGELYRDSSYSEVSTKFIGNIGEQAVFLVHESSPFPSDFDFTYGDYSGYTYSHVDIFDAEGEMVRSVDLREKIDPLLTDLGIPDVEFAYYEINVSGDSLIFGFPGIMDPDWHEISVDPVSGDTELLPVPDSPGPGLSCLGTSVFSFGDDVISVYGYVGYMLDSGSDIMIGVSRGGNDIGSVCIGDQVSSGGLTTVMWMIRSSEDEYIFEACGSFGLGADIFVLNVSDMSVRQADEGYDWLSGLLDPSDVSVSYDPSAGNIICDRYGLRTIDLENKTSSYIFSFDNCNINRFDIPSLRPVSISDDRIIMAGDVERDPDGYLSENDSMIVVLDRAESNPNAGKDIIRVAVIGRLDYATAEACRIYNSSDSGCFAVLDERYIVSAPEDDQDACLSELADIENSLAVDLIAGDGPDILINAIGMDRFNSSGYLADLSSVIPQGEYFDNVFEAVRTDGSIYQMPLTCGIEGISTGIGNVDGDGRGMTYGDYLSFVDSVCNGEDPVDRTRLDFFCLCLDNMSDVFRDNGSLSFDNNEFRDLARFVRDNINDPIEDTSDPLLAEFDRISDRVTDHPARFTSIESFDQYLRDYKYSAITPCILGIPSADGRGPTLLVPDSAAVSASSHNPEGCMRFISVLLSEDIQNCYADGSKTPVNIAAFENGAREVSDRFNLINSRTRSETSDAEMVMNGLYLSDATEDDIAYYEELIGSCDHLPSADNAVMLIVREEIQAYFAGQKTLDEVISLIGNRVATFENERG